jgi:predicted dehydrogenase
MEKKIRIGVIGSGRIAQIAHIPYLKELPQYELVAICDLSPKIIENVGAQYGILNRYVDYKKMLSEVEMDAVLVSNHDHYQLVVDAANAGKHIMVEKPIAFNLEQADHMIAAAKKNNVKLMVGYMKRFDPGYQYAIDKFNSMKDLHLIRVHVMAGKFFINDEIYDLVKNDDLPDELVYEMNQKMMAAKMIVIGEENADYLDTYHMLIRICSHNSIVLHEAFGSPTEILYSKAFGEDSVVAVLKYGDNTRCMWESGMPTDTPDWGEHIAAFGTEQRVEANFPFPYLKNEATLVNINEMEGDANIQKRVLVSYDEAYKREWRHFYDCITKDIEPITSGEKGRRDLAFLIDLFKAAMKQTIM